MKKSGFSEEQIVGVLKEGEAIVPVKELCRRIGINDATFYNWKAMYGELEVNQARRLRSTRSTIHKQILPNAIAVLASNASARRRARNHGPSIVRIVPPY